MSCWWSVYYAGYRSSEESVTGDILTPLCILLHFSSQWTTGGSVHSSSDLMKDLCDYLIVEDFLRRKIGTGSILWNNSFNGYTFISAKIDIIHWKLESIFPFMIYWRHSLTTDQLFHCSLWLFVSVTLFDICVVVRAKVNDTIIADTQ